MPMMSVQDYSEPEQLEAAYTGADAEITPTRRGPMAARIVRLELEHLWVCRVHESTPRIKWATQTPDRAFIRFLNQPGGEFVIDGAVLQTGEIIHLGRGHAYYDRIDGLVDWAGLSLPFEQMAVATTAITGRDLMVPREPVRVTPQPKAMRRLRRLHADALALVDATPHAEFIAEAGHSLEQSLIDTMIDCLVGPDTREPAWARQCHSMVMRRFQRLLEAYPHRALYLPETCAAIGVPERTLRLCCQEHLGMGPKRYLLLRRLHLVERALQQAQATETSVTEIATRFGFWHFGRFAGSYRTAIGELPSATLARPRD